MSEIGPLHLYELGHIINKAKKIDHNPNQNCVFLRFSRLNKSASNNRTTLKNEYNIFQNLFNKCGEQILKLNLR